MGARGSGVAPEGLTRNRSTELKCPYVVKDIKTSNLTGSMASHSKKKRVSDLGASRRSTVSD
uniref:Uncharacterized protein n=1 Tax=Leersia perrieri TaxID=77586 RepID=A0A0D9WYT5_9ORYZ